jgi:hypothetical protein
VFVGLGSSQGCVRIQLHQIIFEHAFNIWLDADTPHRIRACRDQPTTPHQSGQHRGFVVRGAMAPIPYGARASVMHL